MSWLSIILWLVANLPDLIALIWKFWRAKDAIAPTASVVVKAQLSEIIQRNIPRKEKRALIRSILERVVHGK